MEVRMDTGWRRNKYGGLFKIDENYQPKQNNTNQYMNDKIRKEGKKEKDKAYQLTDDNLQQIIDESISKWDDHYAQLYISKISPDDFLELTTDYNMYGYIKDEVKELDLAKVQGAKYVADMMYLDVDLETGLVNGHEGRHRMMALKNAGYKQVDIVVWPRNYDKYNAKEYTNKKITAQEGTGFSSKYKDFSTELKQLIPVSKANVDRIKRRDY